MLLLDTHVWIWGAEHDERLGARTRRLIEHGDAQDLLRISPISVLELATLHTVGRVRFTRSLVQWIRGATERVRLAELTMDVAVDAGLIPRTALADPLDRVLVATARHVGATLVTADRAILTYARGGHVRVHDASK